MAHLRQLRPSEDLYATQVVDALLDYAGREKASDIHIVKCSQGLRLRVRQLGSLVELGEIPDGRTAQVLSRIKAIARLVSYRSDIPQEGRFQFKGLTHLQEARVGTLPLVDGERAVIRLATQETLHLLPNQLGFSEAVLERLLVAIQQASGVILVTGPAGSGKTTTAYSVLRLLALQSEVPRSLVSLEDPVEVVLKGVSQSQINPAAGYSWEEGLRAILRQDPEVLLVGEIRDDTTARLVFQAAMTGQLVISTLHARSAADSVRRLLDMQVPVHHLLSSLEFLVCQKLNCQEPMNDTALNQGFSTNSGCLSGRRLICELLPTIESELAEAVIKGFGGREIESAARQFGMITFAEQ